VEYTLTNQEPILPFVEDNWALSRISGSADAGSGSLDSMFAFIGLTGGRAG
jgi:hypothetical protein